MIDQTDPANSYQPAANMIANALKSVTEGRMTRTDLLAEVYDIIDDYIEGSQMTDQGWLTGQGLPITVLVDAMHVTIVVEGNEKAKAEL